MRRDQESQHRDWTTIVSAAVIMLGLLVLMWLLSALNVLDSDDAAAWVTAIATSGLIIVALVALWPAARQARLAARAVENAARASAESHRPYVTVMTRTSIEGFLYLDLVNHGNRAAIDVKTDFSGPLLLKTSANAEDPFGSISYLAPNERRSVMYSRGSDSKDWPPELVVEITYSGEDGTAHEATLTHNLEALKCILSNPDNKKTPQALLKDGLAGIEKIVTNAIQQATGRGRGI